MGSSLVIGSSLRFRRVQLEHGGQAPPWQGPLSAPPPCAISHSVPPNSQFTQGLPQFRGFGVQGAVSPLVCSQVTPNPPVIRAMGWDFFLPWNLPLFFPMPPIPGPSLLQMCHHGGA